MLSPNFQLPAAFSPNREFSDTNSMQDKGNFENRDKAKEVI